MSKLMDSWYARIGVALSVPVYIESVPEDRTGNYVLLRAESETDTEQNDKTEIKEAIVITDIVTFFQNMINTATADAIDNEICVLISATPYHGHNLAAQAGMQITRMYPENSTYLQEDDGQKKLYRKVTRWNHLIVTQ